MKYENEKLLKFGYGFLKELNTVEALESFCIYNLREFYFYLKERNYELLKLSSFKYSYNECLLFKMTNNMISIDGINLAIISDSEEMLNRYLIPDFWSINRGGKSNEAHNYIKAIQSIYKMDVVELEKQYNFFLNGKRVHKAYKGMSDFIKGILDNDNILIQKGIDTQLKNNKILTFGESDDYASKFTIALIKVAISKGYKINEHPLVPNELIKIQPLDIYERYDFWDSIENGEPLKYVDPFEGQYDLPKKVEDVPEKKSNLFSFISNFFKKN